ncbi:hypothetical protein EMIT0347P_40202 [Pseudomonas sp. IT-347P]|uniref:hypothetical protein n=1 Tax=Pseudomonas sp. IT-347P TaxID=3026458 RepID=UPI0039DF4B29
MSRTLLPMSSAPSGSLPATHAELAYPSIRYASNNSLLYPLDARKGTVATILVANMQAAPVTLYWAIKDKEQPAFDPIVVDGNTSGNVEVPIPWQWVSTCIGHTVLIWYTATVDDQLKESLVLELEIQDVRAEDLVDSLPQFLHSELENDTWWLDMKQFQGDEIIQFNAWPLIQPGQRVFVVAAGDQHQIPIQFRWVAFDHVVTDAEVEAGFLFQFKLSRGWMSRRQEASSLTILMGVIWDGTEPVFATENDPVRGSPLPLNAQDFQLRTTALLRVDPALYLPAPHLEKSVHHNNDGWVLDPLDTLDGTNLIIDYDGMQAGDIVCPVFEGAAGPGSPTLECRTVRKDEALLEFPVPPSAIRANFARSVTLGYSVSHNDTGPWESSLRVVNVLDISKLPAPMVTQANDDVLDLSTFSGDADVIVTPWPYIERGQLCSAWVTGKFEDGSPYRFEVLECVPVSEIWLADGVRASLSRKDLQRMADGTLFEVHFAVDFHGKTDDAPTRVFPLVPLTFRRPLIEISEFFEELTVITYNAGGILQTPTMTVIFESGAGLAGIGRNGSSEFYSGQHFLMCHGADHQIPPQVHRFDFKHPLEYVKFGWVWKQRLGTVSFYDQFNNVLEEFSFSDDTRRGLWVEFSAPEGALVTSMRVLASDYSFLDNFTMRYRE